MCFQSSSQICSYNLFYTHRQRQASHCCLFRSGEHVGMFPLLVKSRIFLCLMDRCANSLRAEEGCFEKQEKLGSAPAFVKMLTKREKKKEKKTWQNSASLLFLLSVSETRSPCPNLHRTTWFSLTGESKDKMNTHWQTHTHTYIHTPLVRTPRRPAVCWGADEGIARLKTKCVSMRVGVCVTLFLWESHYVVFHVGNWHFLPLLAISQTEPWLSCHNTHPLLTLNGWVKFSHCHARRHTRAYTCTRTHALSPVTFSRSTP